MWIQIDSSQSATDVVFVQYVIITCTVGAVCFHRLFLSPNQEVYLWM